jgi:hypothetical protein
MSSPPSSPSFADQPRRCADARPGHGCRDPPLWLACCASPAPPTPSGCAPGDNLMVHAAIYRRAGDVIVVEAGDVDYAVAGGNVRGRPAPRRGGIRGGRVIRDAGGASAASRSWPAGSSRFPAPRTGLARWAGRSGSEAGGASRRHRGGRRGRRRCCCARDPRSPGRRARAEKDAATSLDAWEKAHRARIDETLKKLGF